MATKSKNTEQETTKTKDDEKARAAARSTAASRLRDAHRSEYDQILQEEMSARGIDWTPRPSKEEKARQQVKNLLAEYPGLLDD